MSEKPFTPRVGRIGDRGAGAAKRYGARVRKAAAKLARPAPKKRFSGANLARGTAAGRAASFRTHPFAKFRMRRVVVKVHIARAGKCIGKAAFRAHLNYIQRDGVTISDDRGAERSGVLYDKTKDGISDDGFLGRSEDDRHQFRVIVSAEDGVVLGDLKDNTRTFMAGVEKDLGTKLDWVAVDHHNTGHPHTHIVIRGKDQFGRDLVIAPEYLMRGMRRHASELVTERLGPRRDLEIARSTRREVDQDRMTGIDRHLRELAKDGVVSIAAARDPYGRFHRTLQIARLKHLERLRLASPDGAMRWRFADGWADTLAAMGKRGDIIRSIAAATGDDYRGPVAIFDNHGRKTVLGRVAANGPGDELRDTRFLVIDGVDGKRWHVALGAHEPGALPPAGAVVEAAPFKGALKPSDRTIQRIAAVSGGLYSDALHKEDDPASMPAYRTAHKRRLEALRRAGFVERRSDGVFVVPADYLQRVAKFEAGRGGGVKLDVKSWIDLQAQIDRRAPTWLDNAATTDLASSGFGAELADAKRRRAVFLVREGLAEGGFGKKQRAALIARELHAAGVKAAKASGLAYTPAVEGAAFEGIYQRPLNLAQGRFALIAKSKEFTLVPWRPELERQRGRMIVVKTKGTGIEWTVGKSHGISR